MNTKKSSNVAKAVDIAYAQVKKDSGMTPMDLFMVGVGYTGVGVAMINTNWMQGSLKVLGGFIVGTGLLGMFAIRGKL
jgi:hypothetical protein